jgi:lysophospholipase L1-like esterase
MLALVGLAIFGSQITLIVWPEIANAEAQNASWSWVGGQPNVFSSTQVAGYNDWCSGFLQNEEIAGVIGLKETCIISNGGIKFGIYTPPNVNFFAPAIGFSYDSKMYRVNGVCQYYDSCLYSPDNDTLITKQSLPNGIARSLVIYRNFTHRLTRFFNSSRLATEYNFDASNPDYVFQDANNQAWAIGGLGISNNGKWLAIEFRQRGIGLLNLETLEMKRVSMTAFSYNVGMDPTSELAVSNDGGHMAVMGMNSGASVIDINSSCGDEATDDRMSSFLPIDHPCSQADIKIDNLFGRFFVRPRFNDNGGELSFYIISSDGLYEIYLRANGYNGQTISYLALGDSYTSGEGETDDKYYLNGTNDEFEKCHISYRSYPFLISDSMGISPSDMASVACSGAETKDVVGDDVTYWGQGGRLGDKNLNLSKADRVTIQTQSLYSFSPGRVHQESFVKEYSPKVITIGIGGNDAGLMGKLSTCATGVTCDWANDAKDREQAADEIKSLFGTLVKTYKEIHIASPKSKIYAIGYPKIIDPNGQCGALTGYLFDSTERQFMNESIIYLNQVIEAAAKSAGIKYIDIQDSYGGHVLCGSESPSAMSGVRLGDDNQYYIGNESFHPNSLGHTYDADAIIGSVGNLMDYNYCDNRAVICPDSTVVAPEPSTYWIPDGHHNYPSRHIADFVSDRDDSTDNRQKQINLDSNSLAPNSSVDIYIASEPRLLGQFTSANDGSFDASVDLPVDLEEGYHTVHLYGTSYSGEPIELYQIIEYRKPVVVPPTEEPVVVGDTDISQTTPQDNPQTTPELVPVNTQKVDEKNEPVTISDNTDNTKVVANGIQKTDDVANNIEETTGQIASLTAPEIKGASVVVDKSSVLAKAKNKGDDINILFFYAVVTLLLVALATSLFIFKRVRNKR